MKDIQLAIHIEPDVPWQRMIDIMPIMQGMQIEEGESRYFLRTINNDVSSGGDQIVVTRQKNRYKFSIYIGE